MDRGSGNPATDRPVETAHSLVCAKRVRKEGLFGWSRRPRMVFLRRRGAMKGPNSEGNRANRGAPSFGKGFSPVDGAAVGRDGDGSLEAGPSAATE